MQRIQQKSKILPSPYDQESLSMALFLCCIHTELFMKEYLHFKKLEHMETKKKYFCTESITLSRLSYIPSVLLKNCCLTSVNCNGKNHDNISDCIRDQKGGENQRNCFILETRRTTSDSKFFLRISQRKENFESRDCMFNYTAAGEIVLSPQEMGKEEKQVRFQVCMLFQVWGRMSKLQTKTLATVALRIPHCNCQRGKASLRSFYSSPTSCS